MTKKAHREGLTQKCMVLVALHDEGAGTWSELKERTGLNDGQITQALQALRRERKVIVLQERHSHDGGNIYGFNDTWNPTMCVPDRRWQRIPEDRRKKKNAERTGQSKVATVRKMVDREVSRLPDYIRFRDKKIATLRKIMPIVSADDRDVLCGIVADYERGSR